MNQLLNVRNRRVSQAASGPCIRIPKSLAPQLLGCAILALSATATANGTAADDRKSVAALDTAYQKAVERNDAKTMARLLADDFIVYDGDGKSYTKADLIKSATDGSTRYEHQQDSEQTVRIWGNTAVVTAKLWVKGIEDGAQVDYMEWFSDTYVRTSTGWRYVFGQASLPLPNTSRKKNDPAR